MYILGIESSHDDTSISVIKNFNVVICLKISQIDIHKKYGGTIPEIASREHFQNFYILLEELKTKFDLDKIDLIAFTEKPGLIGSLQMGKLFAHALSKTLKKPIIPIDHLDGHTFSVLLDNNLSIEYPAISFIISGGHTNLYFLKNPFEKELLGHSVDDAAGEVFDKVCRILFNDFPGGPKIDEIFYENYNKDFSSYQISKSITKNKFDFSFSGFKTQIVNWSKKDNIDKELLATSFQKCIVDYIIEKIKIAINEYKPKSIILSGGVSANKYLRSEFSKLHKKTLIPNIEYTTDNGAMIAVAALILKVKKNKKV